MATQIKITQLTNIGSANIAGTTLLPVVNMTGVPTTQKTTLGNLANVILSQAGGNYAAAGTANIAYSVANAAQPNITSVGTLTNVTVSGNVTGGNLVTGGVLSVTGNANIGNIGTGGLITATGNITGANLVTGGVLSVTGNATVNGNITSIGTSYVGNLSTTGLASITTLSVGSTANLGAVGNIKIAGGTSGYVLRTDGAGNLSWVAQAGGGGAPGGATTQVQFNDAGSFAGNAGFTFNKSTGGLALPGDLTGPASANFTIYSNAGTHEFIFGSDGTFYAPDDVVLSGNNISIGPGAAELTGLEHAVLVASSDHFAYIQGVINNVSDNGSADWVALGARGDDGGGWADLGFTSSGFNDANYTITGNGDGYVFVESYATGQTLLGGGGNLVLATGNQGTTKDIIFGTSGFLTGNIFGRISHANNALELSRTSSNLNLSGGGNINLSGGGITQVINQELNIVVQDEEDDGWSIFNTITDGAGTSLSQTQLDSTSFTIATAPSGTNHAWGFEGNTLQVSNDSQIRSFASNIALQSMSSGTGGTASLQSISNTNDPNIFTTFDATTTGANISVYNGGSSGGTEYTWQFSNDGKLTFPGTPRIDTADDNFEVQAAEAINFEANTVVNIYTDSSDNAYQWQFGDDGNLTLPRGGVIAETGIPFGGLEGNTIALKPAGGTNVDQQLLVYPTAGQDFNHLHLTSGNLYNTELFLGDDNFYVKLANTGNIVINTNDSVGNTYQLNITPFGEVLTTGDLFLQTPNGVPNDVTAITSSSGSWESNPVTNLATTNGTGAGLTVNVTQTGGYASAIAIATPGTGYANGDTITVASGSSSATFTISVANNQWILDTQGELTLPTLSLGSGLNEQTVIRSQRKLIPPFRWSAVIDDNTPTVVYNATSVDTTSMKVTMQIQHQGLGMEFFEVFATMAGSDTYYTVGNRVAPPTIDASTVVVGLGAGNTMKITVTINSGAGTSWVTYDAVEFGIPND